MPPPPGPVTSNCSFSKVLIEYKINKTHRCHLKHREQSQYPVRTFKWSIIYKNITSLCCTPETHNTINQLYFRKPHTQYTHLLCDLVAKSCPTLCDPGDCSPAGSSLCGISQARMLEWVAISFSRGPSRSKRSNPYFLLGRQILYCCAT